jgi:hypothetical protein
MEDLFTFASDATVVESSEFGAAWLGTGVTSGGFFDTLELSTVVVD